MNSQTSILHRVMAACASVAITVSLLVSYVAVPNAQTVAGMLA